MQTVSHESPVAVQHRSGGVVAVLQSTGGRAIFILINALTGMITARALHPNGRGELAAIAVWPNFLPNLVTIGIPSALIYRIRQNPLQSVGLARAALYLTFILGGVSTVLGIVAMPFWLSRYSPHIIHLAQLFMLNSTVVLLIALLRALCESRADFFASAVSFALTPLITLAMLIGLRTANLLTPGTAALGYVAGGIPTLFYLGRRTWKDFHGALYELKTSASLLLSYGIRSYGVDFCGTLSLYADQALVVRLLTPSAMGIYVVALSLSRMLNIIQASVASILFPRAVKLDVEDLVALTARAARVSTLLSVLAGIAVALASPVVLPLLYGSDYRSASVILDVLIAEAILTGLTLVLTQAYMAVGRPGLVTVLQSVGVVLSIPLLIVLIPKFGLMGASAALLIASAIRLLLTIGSLRVLLHMQISSLLPRFGELKQLQSALLRT